MSHVNRRTVLSLTGNALLVPMMQGYAFAQTRSGTNPIKADIARVSTRLGHFFDNINRASAASPPPGVGASNGYFVNFMQNDTTLAVLQRPMSTMSPDGAVLATLAQSLMQKCRDGFAPGIHGANWITSWDLAEKMFKSAIPSLLHIAVDIVAAVYSGGAIAAAATADINTQVQALIDASNHDGPFGGDHANGWISAATRDRATEFIAEADQKKAGLDPDIQDTIEILKVFAQQMAKLSTAGHDPWLKAEWQIGYTAITTAAAKIMFDPTLI